MLELDAYYQTKCLSSADNTNKHLWLRPYSRIPNKRTYTVINLDQKIQPIRSYSGLYAYLNSGGSTLYVFYLDLLSFTVVNSTLYVFY